MLEEKLFNTRMIMEQRIDQKEEKSYLSLRGTPENNHDSFFEWSIGQQTGLSKIQKHGRFGKFYKQSWRQRHIRDMQSQLYFYLSKTASSHVGYGAVFNLEFSPSGKILVAACEDNAIKFYDPLSLRQIHCVPKAHADCVNCVRFLDERTFTSGSDDCTVALWDYRNLRQKVSELKGHRNWVKSIEYSQRTGQLITSAFDGKVYAWDINSYSSEAAKPTELLRLERLMRTRLTPDDNKMILSTSLGYYVIIHDLDLSTLTTDLENFVSDDYYLLLQEKDPKELLDHRSNHVFHQKRNRVELVMDFPPESFPWCISSLVVHPQGWCMMSRFTSEMEDSEWTCVHDIQEDSFNFDKSTVDQQRKNNTPFVPKQRLLYHVSEPNDGRGYIKEISVSPDGRFICSSFGFGIRLLSFDGICRELCDINPKVGESKTLTEKCMLLSHQRTVVTSKFSPTHPILATGCLEGKIVFHEARL